MFSILGFKVLLLSILLASGFLPPSLSLSFLSSLSLSLMSLSGVKGIVKDIGSGGDSADRGKKKYNRVKSTTLLGVREMDKG